jgi:hypothetical protein
MPSIKAFNQEVDRIRRLFKNMPFAQCLEIEPPYRNLTFQAGLYALKSHQGEVLYVGKTSAYRTRFQQGHHALLRMLMRGIPVDEIRIVLAPANERFVDDIEMLERHLIVAFDPVYNVYKPDMLEVVMMVQTRAQVSPVRLKELIQALPDPVIEQIEAHADQYGLSEERIVERAITFFLDHDAVNFADIQPGKMKSLGALAEENIFLADENQFLKDQLSAMKERLRAMGEPEP